MHINFCLSDQRIYDAFRTACDNGVECPRLESGSILRLDVEAIVSPANSFGIMDGGLDAQYLDAFGASLQNDVQRVILNQNDGELPVGQATAVRINHKQILIVAPTMRVPMILPKDTVNPYLATRAALIAARVLDVTSIAIPAMGAGVGRVPPDICARQMLAAYVNFIHPPTTMPASFRDVQNQHQSLYCGAHRDLQHYPFHSL